MIAKRAYNLHHMGRVQSTFMLTNLISAVQNVLNKEASAKLSCGYITSAT
jgi:hypothetical protein